MRTTITLLLLLLGSATALADDHGNSPFAASPIAPDGTLTTACIEGAGDMDYFLFDATAGRTYRVSTSHPTDGMDSLLYLIGRDGQEIIAVDDNSAGDTNARIVWTCPETGIYFLLVRHAQATLGTGCYGLSVSIVLLDDHGDDILGATPMTSGTTISGFLEEPGDVDVFVVQVDPGYEYSVHFFAQNSDAPLALTATRNASSDPVLALTSLGTAKEGVLTSPAAGAVFLIVSAASGAATGSYTLTIERGGYADDHGNSAMDATPLSVQWVEILGRLEVSGDADWFRWEARQDAEYTFVVSSTDGTSGVRVAIRGANAQLLNESATGALSESVEIVWQAPQSGTYYLEISSSNGIGGYRLNASATLQLEAIGSLNPSGYSLDIEVRGDTAYLIVGTKGLLIIDVADPTSPFEIGSHSTNGYAQALAVADGAAYVANRSEGITVVDVSDPSRPIQIGTFDTPGSAQSIAIHGSLALIADQRGGLQIARIRSDGSLELVGGVETAGYAAAVAASGNTAYVVIGDAGLEVIDLSVPEAPVSLARLDLAGDANGIALYDDVAYVAAGYRGVRIVDISDPENPAEVGSINTAGEAIDVRVEGNSLYVAERTAGLSVYSLADPTAPRGVAQIDTPGEAVAIAVGAGHVYVADRQEGLLIVRLLQ